MLSVPHLIIIFLVALLVFGPEKLPELARTLSKAMGEFHRLTGDFQETVQREMRQIEREALEQGNPKPAASPAALPTPPASPEAVPLEEEFASGIAPSPSAMADGVPPGEELEEPDLSDSAATAFEAFDYDAAKYVAAAAAVSGEQWPLSSSGKDPLESPEKTQTAEVSRATDSPEAVNAPSEEKLPAATGAEKPVHDHHPTAA